MTPGGGVMVVGSVNLDYVVSAARRPGPGETVGDASLSLLGGGKGANQAAAAAACGAAVGLVALLGADPAGDERLRQLAAGGVDTSGVERTAAAPTGSAFVTVTPDGENSIVVVPGANGELGEEQLERAAGALRRAAVLVVQLEVPLAAVLRAVELALDAVVVLNASPARPLPPELLARTGVLVVNEQEAADLAGLPVHGLEQAEAAARVLELAGPRSVIVTLGAAGALLAAGPLVVHVDAPAVEVVDTTGAGDAFVGALAARLARGEDLAEATSAGVAVGAATVGRLGAGAVVPASWRGPIGARGLDSKKGGGAGPAAPD